MNRLRPGISVRVINPIHPQTGEEQRALMGSVRQVLVDLGDDGVVVKGSGSYGQPERTDILDRSGLVPCGWSHHEDVARRNAERIAPFLAERRGWITAARDPERGAKLAAERYGEIPGAPGFWRHELERIAHLEEVGATPAEGDATGLTSADLGTGPAGG